MLGKRSAQRGIFEADHLYLDFVERGSFYGFLASQRDQIFSDEEATARGLPDPRCATGARARPSPPTASSVRSSNIASPA